MLRPAKGFKREPLGGETTQNSNKMANPMPRSGFFLSLVLLTGCQAFSGSDKADLAGGVWLLEEIGGRSVLNEVQATLSVDNGSVGGSTGCNRYSAPVTLSGTKIDVGRPVSTRRACEPDVMDQERRFLTALETSSDYRIEGGVLHLLGRDGQELLQLTLQKN